MAEGAFNPNGGPKNFCKTASGTGTAADPFVPAISVDGFTFTGDVEVDTDQLETLTGALTETAPATDIASSGLNGRLQRIAQRITSLIALLPAALTGSGNFKVAISEASELHHGEVGGNSATTKPTIAVDTGGAYGAGDSLFGLLTLTDIARENGKGIVPCLILRSGEGQKPTGVFQLFDANPTASTFTANGELVIDAADRPKLIGPMPVVTADWVQCDANLWVCCIPLPCPAVPGGSSKTFYGAFRVDNTPTYSTSTSVTAALANLRQ